jgi:uncharacterized protein YidB (DUF937 family)
MGLLDILNGMANGPRGQTEPGKGGMSPLTMALLGLLAYKAYQKMSAPQPGATPSTGTGGGSGGLDAGPGGGPGGGLGGGLGGALGSLLGGAGGGGLGNLLQGGLGGLLGGAAGGSVLNGGLNDLLGRLQQNGLGDVGNSWVGHGENMAISPHDLAKTLDGDTVSLLAQHTGMSDMEVLSALSQQLPDAIHHVTPQGRVPTDHEVSQML